MLGVQEKKENASLKSMLDKSLEPWRMSETNWQPGAQASRVPYF
jgi:hypothetical protein